MRSLQTPLPEQLTLSHSLISVEQLIPVNPGEQDANGAGIEAVGRILVKIADGDRD